mmetsp:Transcript_14984/g.29436  ORF Transcript_14984/g.29436 Transcript_14984/m.29436 type:complete len:257 (+) Transcript_14984:3142-3912(+)
MRIGKQPCVPVYVIALPLARKASTRSAMGLSFIRWLPVKTTSPSCMVATKVVRKRLAVPALLRYSSQPLLGARTRPPHPCMTSTRWLSSHQNWTPSAFRASSITCVSSECRRPCMRHCPSPMAAISKARLDSDLLPGTAMRPLATPGRTHARDHNSLVSVESGTAVVGGLVNTLPMPLKMTNFLSLPWFFLSCAIASKISLQLKSDGSSVGNLNVFKHFSSLLKCAEVMCCMPRARLASATMPIATASPCSRIRVT